MMMKNQKLVELNRKAENSQLTWFQGGTGHLRLFLATPIMITKSIFGDSVVFLQRLLICHCKMEKMTLITGTYFKGHRAIHCLPKKKRKVEIKHKLVRTISLLKSYKF